MPPPPPPPPPARLAAANEAGLVSPLVCPTKADKCGFFWGSSAISAPGAVSGRGKALGWAGWSPPPLPSSSAAATQPPSPTAPACRPCPRVAAKRRRAGSHRQPHASTLPGAPLRPAHRPRRPARVRVWVCARVRAAPGARAAPAPLTRWLPRPGQPPGVRAGGGSGSPPRPRTPSLPPASPGSVSWYLARTGTTPRDGRSRSRGAAAFPTLVSVSGTKEAPAPRGRPHPGHGRPPSQPGHARASRLPEHSLPGRGARPRLRRLTLALLRATASGVKCLI